MIPIPAIDVKDGKVVRLIQGNFKEEKIYFDKPETVAKHFEEEGARRLHIVDLNGALEGTPKNAAHIEKILKAVKIPVELGGGIRRIETAKFYLNMGVSWVIFGTKACLDRHFTQEAIAEFKGKAIVGIDALNGFLATDGWTKITQTKAVEFAKNVEMLGCRTVIYTDIAKDGVLKGPNFQEIKNISQSLSIDLIASGGVGSLADIKGLLALGRPNIKGVIIGKALYENKFTMREAIGACSQKE